jgi:DNA adenine methylase
MAALKAPMPWFGGKSSVADLIWARFGDVPNLVDPFAGSLAVLLARPHAPKVETVNDVDALLCNFWRALQADPEAVARHADWPVSEVDLHARHLWLLDRKADVARLIADPDWHDAKIAGWWVWGLCCWIGSGWCSGRGPWRLVDGVLTKDRAVGELDGVAAPRAGDIYTYLGALSERLRRVRICCGDWRRVVTPAVTERHGLTAILLDPPYAHEGRDDDLYIHDEDISGEVREWALANGDNSSLRIAYCGYWDEHQVWPEGWEIVRWSARGGYGSQGGGRGMTNRTREFIAFSPACLKPEKRATLFDVDAYVA